MVVILTSHWAKAVVVVAAAAEVVVVVVGGEKMRIQLWQWPSSSTDFGCCCYDSPQSPQGFFDSPFFFFLNLEPDDLEKVNLQPWNTQLQYSSHYLATTAANIRSLKVLGGVVLIAFLCMY